MSKLNAHLKNLIKEATIYNVSVYYLGGYKYMPRQYVYDIEGVKNVRFETFGGFEDDGYPVNSNGTIDGVLIKITSDDGMLFDKEITINGKTFPITFEKSKHYKGSRK